MRNERLTCGCRVKRSPLTQEPEEYTAGCWRGRALLGEVAAAMETGDREAFLEARDRALQHFGTSSKAEPRRFMYAARRPLLPNGEKAKVVE